MVKCVREWSVCCLLLLIASAPPVWPAAVGAEEPVEQGAKLRADALDRAQRAEQRIEAGRAGHGVSAPTLAASAIPAKAGTQLAPAQMEVWVPALAGMTPEE